MPSSAKRPALLYRPRHPLRFPLSVTLFLLLAAATLVLIPMGCGGSEPDEEIPAEETEAADSASDYPVTVTDATGADIVIPARPERIVSTAPANTEILFAVGAGGRIVGVTSLDDYPPEVERIEKIGDFQPNVEKILSLEPDLVLGYAGNEEVLQPVSGEGIPVVIMNPRSVEEIFSSIEMVGRITGRSDAAEEVVLSLRAEMEGIANAAEEAGSTPRVFYALDNTLWTAGPNSFVDALLNMVSAENIAAAGPSDYFQYTPEELIAADPDIVLLPKSVYTSTDEFTEDPRLSGLRAVAEGNVRLVDDVIITRPGPRIAEGLRVLAEAVHPDVF
ncbi:MAG: ABC transporter substrate-binding protein [Thermoleophilia bacterium]